jgi:L-fuconolactonase
VPDFPIIDSHVHLYDVGRLSYHWLQRVPKINRTYLVEDFDRARGPVEVDGIVFAEVAVDPGMHLEEVAFVEDLARRDPRLRGIVAHVPLERGTEVQADLEALRRNPRVKGIRRLIETEVDQSFCLAPDFLAALKLLPRYGFTFDICVKHWGMVFAIEPARRCPEVSFVLDHLGKPGIRHGLHEPWWHQIRELARCSNVVCKLSGVVTEADHAHWTRADVLPYIAHAIDCFGFERIMYGSDWTVSELTHPYPEWVSIVDEALAGTSVDEKRSVYRDTVTKTYGL